MSKILLISQEFPPAIGGAGSVAQNTASLLSETHDVTVLTMKRRPRENYPFRMEEAKYLPKIFPLLLYLKFCKVYTQDTHTIVLNDIGSSMLAAYFFTKKQQRKSVVFLQGSEPERIFLNPSRINRFTGFKQKYIELLQNVKKIVPVSEYMKEKFLDATGLYSLKDKVTTIYNGIDLSTFRRIPSDLHAKYGIDSSRKILLSVSSIKEGKGYLDKYDIFKRLVHNGCNYQWVIAGDGPLLPQLKEMAQRDGLDKHITLTGAVKREELCSYYSGADIFWLLSNLNESLGLVYIEAIACGTAAIGRNRAGAKEIIIAGVNGFLAEDNEDCYNILYGNMTDTIDSADIRRTIQKFSNEEIAQKLRRGIE